MIYAVRATRPGSSPRIRGEFSLRYVRSAATGIIPANTGRIRIPSNPRHDRQDHPREYGENMLIFLSSRISMGSSPRIRGESRCSLRLISISGIIPANTGRIVRLGGFCVPRWDHPREYGENRLVGIVQLAVSGSSPRIRGEFFPKPGFIFRIGIIPANTGRIASTCLKFVKWWDHPREYGEKGFGRRLRGFQTRRDHPREYGENNGTSLSGARCKGSSPRIRGEFP